MIKIFLKNKVLQNFGIYTFGTFLLGLINVLLLPVYSSYIVPNDYGLLNLIMYIINASVLFIDFGQNMAFSVRYYKTSEDKRSTLALNSLFICFIVLIPVILLFLCWKGFLTFCLKTNVPYTIQVRVVLIIFLTVFTNYFTNLLRLKEEAFLFLSASVLKSLVMGGLNVLFLVYLHQSYDSYLNAVIVSLLVLFIWGIFYLKNEFNFSEAKISFNQMKTLLKLGSPLLPYGLLMLIFIAGDKFILNTLMSTSIVGLYAFGYRIGSLIDPFLTSPLGQAISPTLFRVYNESIDRYIQITRSIWVFYIFLAFFVLMGMSVFADLLYHLFIGKQYWGSFYIAIIIMFGYILLGMGTMLGGAIVVKEKTYLSPFMVLITGSVNILLNFVLIHYLGFYGAAIALVLGSTISFLLYYKISQRLIKVVHAWTEIIIITAISICVVSINLYLSNVININPCLIFIKFIFLVIGVGIIILMFGKKFIQNLKGVLS